MARRAWIVVVGLLASCGPGEPPGDGRAGASQGERVAGAGLGASPEELHGLQQQAHAVYLTSDYDSAIVLFRTVEVTARTLDDHRTTALALMWIGHAFRWLGDYEQARLFGEEALSIRIERGLGEDLPASHNALGLVAWDAGRLLDAAEHFDTSIQLAEGLGNRRAAAVASGNLGLVHTELGDLREARRRFEEYRLVMAELRRTESDPDTLVWLARAEGNALSNLSMIEVRRGNLRAAVSHAESAIEIYRETDYAAGFQNAIAHLGTAYSGMGEARLAFAALDTALARSRALGLERETASNLEMLAELYWQSGDHGRTLQLYAEAKEINARLGLEIATAVDLRGEAEILMELGELESARTLTEEARSIHRTVGARLEQFRSVLMLAEIDDLMGNDEAVDRELAEARALADQLGVRTAHTELVLTEAQIAANHERSREVLRALGGMDEDLARGDYAREWHVYRMRSEAYANLGGLDSAAVWGRRAIAVVERARSNLGSGVLRSSFAAQKADLYSHLASVLLRLGLRDEALEVSDATRGRALLEYFVGESARSGRPTARVAEAQQFLREISSTLEEIAYFEQIPPEERWDSDAARISMLEERLENKRRSYESMVIRLNASDPDAMVLLGGLRVSAEEIREALEPGELLVEYMITDDDRVVVFGVSRAGIAVAESEIRREDLESRVRLARDLLGVRPKSPTDRASTDAVNRVLEGLYDVLLRPLVSGGALTGVEHIIFVPHQVLSYLPFGALRDRSTRRYVVEDYQISLLPSAATLPALRRRDDSGEVGAASPIAAFAPFPGSLPATEDEVGAIRSKAGVQRFVGSEATEGRVREALRRAGTVHLATHGVMNAYNPMFSRIELAQGHRDDPADDGRLEVHEVLELDVGAALVFLSGCETGVGAAHSTAFIRGEDYATLAQAFLYAGARGVVATLWPVEDEGAKELAGRFYGEVTGGASRALARAQRDMIADERYGAPYYWAAYQLTSADSS